MTIQVTSEMIAEGVRCLDMLPLFATPKDAAVAMYLSMKAAEPLAQGDELERAMFSELVKRGIDQDTADQVSQSVCAALVRSKLPIRLEQDKIAELIAHSMGRFPTDDPVLDAAMAVIAYVNGPRLAALDAHRLQYDSTELLDAFWSQVQVGPAHECWNWTGKQASGGYGAFYFGGKREVAHRVSLRLAGRPVPKGKVGDHVCRNRLCVNPSHLRVVDQRINSIENSASVTAFNKAKTHCKHGHEFTRENTYNVMRGGTLRRYCRTCQRKAQRKYESRNTPSSQDTDR